MFPHEQEEFCRWKGLFGAKGVYRLVYIVAQSYTGGHEL